MRVSLYLPLCAPAIATDRGVYCPPTPAKAKVSTTYSYGPYKDAPQAIGHKATISAPHIQAVALEALHSHLVRPAGVHLDVGCGSGIITAYMARTASPGSTVLGIEVVPELVATAQENLSRDGFILGTQCNPDSSGNANGVAVVVCQGNGWDCATAASLGPFDAIHVGAGAAEVPQELLRLLKPGGRLVMPIGPRDMQSLVAVDTPDASAGAGAGMVTTVLTERVRFVPLVTEVTPPKTRRRRSDAKTGGDRGSTSAGDQRGVDYNVRYRKGWAYGKDPSVFLKSVASKLMSSVTSPALDVVSLGEGQGRNAVYLGGWST